MGVLFAVHIVPHLAFQRIESVSHRHIEILVTTVFMVLPTGNDCIAGDIDHGVNTIEFALVMLAMRLFRHDMAGNDAGAKPFQFLNAFPDSFVGKQWRREITIGCLKFYGH
jgi:hypothetical protein